MFNDWEDDLLLIEKHLGEKTRNVLDNMIDNGYIPEVNLFIDSFKKSQLR